MLTILPLLQSRRFPPLARGNSLQTLQLNLGYRCNQSCLHCHVGASPHRSEEMSTTTVEAVVTFLKKVKVPTLDLTGGAPELNPGFRRLVAEARRLDMRVIDRSNLTILEEPTQVGLAEFLASEQVEIIASLPCYLEENVDGQRGNGVFQASIRALQQLNALGYGQVGSGLLLNLAYNPTGAFLPPPQQQLEEEYKHKLGERYGIVFNNLYTLTNMPIQRFGSTLHSTGQFDQYFQLLKGAFQPRNLEHVMCKSLISVDWQGWIYDCDFNQMLNLPLKIAGRDRVHVKELADFPLTGNRIIVAGHCFGCTAGQGSSCEGVLGSGKCSV
uniref:Radical SAM/Cys-rich domain-containing protein n=1 Tax=Candidatus Kentrum sp. FW TaxID=2126338 RepID=A0A450U070_9GAMM|nr:MAG: radical SAM/Cys-rich domain-containing protein [Candidatus Kentron sp. FW]